MLIFLYEISIELLNKFGFYRMVISSGKSDSFFIKPVALYSNLKFFFYLVAKQRLANFVLRDLEQFFGTYIFVFSIKPCAIF